MDLLISQLLLYIFPSNVNRAKDFKIFIFSYLVDRPSNMS